MTTEQSLVASQQGLAKAKKMFVFALVALAISAVACAVNLYLARHLSGCH